MNPRCELGQCPNEAARRCDFCRKRICTEHRNSCTCRGAQKERAETEGARAQSQMSLTCGRCGTYFPDGEKDRSYEFFGRLPQCLQCSRHICAKCRVKRTGFEAAYHGKQTVVFCSDPACYPRCPMCRAEVLAEEPFYQCETCGQFVCGNCARFQMRAQGRDSVVAVYRCKRHAGPFSPFKKLDQEFRKQLYR